MVRQRGDTHCEENEKQLCRDQQRGCVWLLIRVALGIPSYLLTAEGGAWGEGTLVETACD